MFHSRRLSAGDALSWLEIRRRSGEAVVWSTQEGACHAETILWSSLFSFRWGSLCLLEYGMHVYRSAERTNSFHCTHTVTANGPQYVPACPHVTDWWSRDFTGGLCGKILAENLRITAHGWKRLTSFLFYLFFCSYVCFSLDFISLFISSGSSSCAAASKTRSYLLCFMSVSEEAKVSWIYRSNIHLISVLIFPSQWTPFQLKCKGIHETVSHIVDRKQRKP